MIKRNDILSRYISIKSRPSLKTGSGADLAFAIVVLASYFVAFSSITSASLVQIALIISLGVAYITIGVYGYGYCARSESFVFQLLYFLIQIPLGGVIVFLSKGAGFNALLLLPLVGHSVLLLQSSWVYFVNAIILIVYVTAVSLYAPGWNAIWKGLPGFLAGQIFVMAFIQMAIDEEKARIKVETLATELAEANEHLREYAARVEELTLIKERNRLAREIHDGLGHYLTTINMQIKAATAILSQDSKRALHTLNKAQALTQDALKDVRMSVAALRASSDGYLPLHERIEKIIASYQIPGLIIKFDVRGIEKKLNYQTEHTFFRAVQEGLNNISKYAQATEAYVIIDYTSNSCVSLIIKDNGVGSDLEEHGFGLLGIQERVHLLDGKYKIISGKNEGFCLEIVIPL